MRKTFMVFWLLFAFIFSACGGGGGGGGDGSSTEPEELYTLTITKTGSGDVSYTDPGSDGGYANGDTVVLTAEPADGWRFDHWEGDATGSTISVSVTVNGDIAVTAVFIQEIDLIKKFLYAAYSGIGYKIFQKDNDGVLYTFTQDDTNLYGIIFEDLMISCDNLVVDSITAIMSDENFTVKMAKVALGISQSFEDLSVDGLNVTFIIVPHEMISTDSTDPSGITVTMEVDIPQSGYVVQNLRGDNITYKGEGSSDLVFTGTGWACMDMDNYKFGMYFESFILNAESTLSASYDDYDVQYKGWAVTASSVGNDHKMLNYFIGPFSLYLYSNVSSQFPSIPEYDSRFYKLNGEFSIDGEEYSYDMMYGQFDGDYQQTIRKVYANERHIGLKGSIEIGEDLVSITSAGWDVFEDIFNGKSIDDVVQSDLANAIKMTNVPETGVWESGSLSLTPANDSTVWEAVFNSDGSVEIDPGNNTVNLWQSVLEFIN